MTKAGLSNRRYGKPLKLDGESNVTLDESKVNQDKKWDGLKGYLAPTTPSNEDVIGHYEHLWKIERA